MIDKNRVSNKDTLFFIYSMFYMKEYYYSMAKSYLEQHLFSGKYYLQFFPS